MYYSEARVSIHTSSGDPFGSRAVKKFARQNQQTNPER